MKIKFFIKYLKVQRNCMYKSDKVKFAPLRKYAF